MTLLLERSSRSRCTKRWSASGICVNPLSDKSRLLNIEPVVISDSSMYLRSGLFVNLIVVTFEKLLSNTGKPVRLLYETITVRTEVSAGRHIGNMCLPSTSLLLLLNDRAFRYLRLHKAVGTIERSVFSICREFNLASKPRNASNGSDVVGASRIVRSASSNKYRNPFGHIPPSETPTLKVTRLGPSFWTVYVSKYFILLP